MAEADGSDESPTASFEREQLRMTLAKFLRPKEMEALSWRYGLVNEDSPEAQQSSPQQLANQYLADAETYLFGSTSPTTMELPDKGRSGEAMSFNEVGKRMKVSAEYGRRLCHAGLAKLRQAAEDGRLEPVLLF